MRGESEFGDVTVFGSGVVAEDDGSAFCLDDSETSTQSNDHDGMNIFLTQIKNVWYRLGRPSKQYAPWFGPVIKIARVSLSILNMLKRERRLFEEYPDKDIKRCPFVTGLASKMQDMNHTKWIIKKKKKILQKRKNLNSRAGIALMVSRMKAIQATTTRLVNRIWGEFCAEKAWPKWYPE
ncbi:unnamed protein product [Arabidopsis thaliana]|uniref:RFTS domain-containing protein n=1 Tax=Arabidopsis thaliana TaxID=3702 RepID=A0A654FP16_ARATH|nr:unnamed protein product [Arabidopsis thaliana]